MRALPLFTLDKFIEEVLLDAEFKTFCVNTIGKELEVFTQVPREFLSGKMDYAYVNNFEKFTDREAGTTLYKSLVNFVIQTQEVTTDATLTTNKGKESIELISMKFMEILENNLSLYGIALADGSSTKKLRVLADVMGIYETNQTDSLELVQSITFGLEKILGECTR